jgi:hypothetical protein
LSFLLYIISYAKMQSAEDDFVELSNIFGTLDKRAYSSERLHTMKRIHRFLGRST